MKAITILQPYAHMVGVTKEKRVENRTWPTNYRGPLLIHAGMGRKLWGRDDSEKYFGVSWGAVVAIANLADVLKFVDIRAGKFDDRYPWLREHEHVHGPWCWVLDHVATINPPYKCRGAQGLFDIDDPALAELARCAK